MRFSALTALLCLCALWSSAAQAQRAETVETDVSTRQIAIESNFSGARLVVFGTVTNSRQTAPESGVYDLAVVIRGPEQPAVLRRKSRVLGIWINTRSRIYQNVPGYYAILSTRPIEEITDKKILTKYGIGFDNILVERDTPDDPFRDAIIRIRQKDGLYRHSDTGVAFIGKSLFRATVDLPANVPVGEYWTDVFVFREGKLLSHSSTTIDLRKEGFERFVFNAAFEKPLLYGIAAVLVAILAGLAASAIFRKD